MIHVQAKKQLGQHFLQDQEIASEIVSLLDIQKNESIFEIGPGQGALTKYIYTYNPKLVYLIEKDHYWASYHMELVKSSSLKNVKVIHKDALRFSWSTLQGAWKIISNLPYNVGSPLIWDIVSQVCCLKQAVFMVQKEVGERLCAVPGTKEYGALSVWVQSFVDVKRMFVVKPNAFKPKPKVDSVVVLVQPKEYSKRPRFPESLAWIIKNSFQQRRKQLQLILRNAGLDHVHEVLECVGIEPASRPESLSNVFFQKLSCEFYLQIIDFL